MKWILILSGLLGVTPLPAAILTGNIAFFGSASLNTSSAQTATAVNSWGSVHVSTTSGSFNTVANNASVSFIGGPWNFNTSSPILNFWTVGGYSFELLSSTVVFQGSGTAQIAGTGAISGNGATPTAFNWTFLVQDPASGPGVWTFNMSAINNNSNAFPTLAVTWNTPAAITNGTGLSATQLNASANIAGSFAYFPPAGTILTAGTATLTSIFTPANLVNYNKATNTVSLVVMPLPPAQIFTNIYPFSALTVQYLGTNRDGAFPEAGLLLSGNTLYGTTYYGGTWSKGTIFRVNTDGTGFMNVHSFSIAGTNSLGTITNSDGANPVSGLILSGGTLYGTAQYGGTNGQGTVFRVNVDGTAFTTLHTFPALLSPFYTNTDGARPQAALILAGNALYGTAEYGGFTAHGTIFKVNTDGMGFTNLYNFTGISDAANPVGGLVLADATLYGTASIGGNYVSGTVFKINTNSTGFTTIYHFTATGDSVYTNGDGAQPFGTLTIASNILYGTTSIGGSAERGTVFSMTTNGTGFKRLHDFTGSDGANQFGGVTLSGNVLYGATQSGGNSGQGTVFMLNTDGTGFASLHSFGGLGGAYPQSGVVVQGNILFGTASVGGSFGEGNVYSLFIEPQLTIARSGTNVLVTWSINYPTFTLQSIPDLVTGTVWSAVSPSPAIVNGQETVTNGVAGAQKFYRLTQ